MTVQLISLCANERFEEMGLGVKGRRLASTVEFRVEVLGLA